MKQSPRGRAVRPLSRASVLAVFAALGALLVSGCVDPGARRSPNSTKDAASTPANSRANAATAPSPEQSASLPSRPAPRAIPEMDPEKLIGLDGGTITALIGKPGFRRIDPPAELWRYRQADCILDIFLYATGKESGPKRATHVEARVRSGQPLPARRCLNAILKARVEGPAG